MVKKGLEAASLVFRVVAVVLGIIALALVVEELWISGAPDDQKCALAKASISGLSIKRDEEPCNLVIAAGALGLVIGVLLAIVNILALVLNAALALVVLPGGRRGKLATLDLVLAVILAILWLATGIYTAVEWKDSRDQITVGGDSTKRAGDATVAFSFFSMVGWIIVAVVAGKIRSSSDEVLPS